MLECKKNVDLPVTWLSRVRVYFIIDCGVFSPCAHYNFYFSIFDNQRNIDQNKLKFNNKNGHTNFLVMLTELLCFVNNQELSFKV